MLCAGCASKAWQDKFRKILYSFLSEAEGLTGKATQEKAEGVKGKAMQAEAEGLKGKATEDKGTACLSHGHGMPRQRKAKAKQGMA